MELNKDQIAELRAYRNKPDEDDIRYKEIIKKMLIENDKIIYLLHNEELEAEDVDNDEYLTQNILSHYMITPTQTSVQNYICFETSFQEISRSNSIIKYQQVIFYVLCHHADLTEKYTNCDRHDLISAVLIDMFQGSNIFGTQLKLMSDRPSVVDTNYACRTLIFEQQTINSLYGRNGGLRVGS
jgi:hypothetical protein